MELEVLVDKCQGHARCQAVAPRVYDLDDEGIVVLKTRSIELKDLADEASRGALSCPERAIIIKS